MCEKAIKKSLLTRAHLSHQYKTLQTCKKVVLENVGMLQFQFIPNHCKNPRDL